MAFSLYDVTVGTYRQVLGATSGFLAKGREHCQENGIDLNEIVQTSLIDDMAPFLFQVVSTAHHSLNALKGTEAGEFGPPETSALDYAGLEKLVADAAQGIEAFTPDTVNGWVGKDMTFVMGDMRIPFTAEDFLMTFSLPNFYFHATTTYDILRMKGVPIGKRDFLGQMRMKM